jgi:hypothetical protein
VNRLVLAALFAPLWLGCRNIERFDTESGAGYCGYMVNFGNNFFIPPGSRPTLALRLELDIDSLTVQPGFLTTNDTDGFCVPAPLFDRAPLRAIPEVMNDPLSLLEFGDGREYNFFAWVDSSCQGTMVSVVSLMKNDEVEVRLLKPKPMPAPEALDKDRPGFILFRLARQDGPCRNF